jgi:hypothetical protein
MWGNPHHPQTQLVEKRTSVPPNGHGERNVRLAAGCADDVITTVASQSFKTSRVRTCVAGNLFAAKRRRNAGTDLDPSLEPFAQTLVAQSQISPISVVTGEVNLYPARKDRVPGSTGARAATAAPPIAWSAPSLMLHRASRRSTAEEGSVPTLQFELKRDGHIHCDGALVSRVSK